jgi:hypothetical protein
MPRRDIRRVCNANLRLDAGVVEVEEVCGALPRAGSLGRRRGLQAEQARAAAHHAAVPAVPTGTPLSRLAVERSCRGRRRALTERGAAWIIVGYGRDDHSGGAGTDGTQGSSRAFP